MECKRNKRIVTLSDARLGGLKAARPKVTANPTARFNVAPVSDCCLERTLSANQDMLRRSLLWSTRSLHASPRNAKCAFATLELDASGNFGPP